jgi:hypothetical protein
LIGYLIKNEYALVIDALVCNVEEKGFLQYKVQNLLCNVASNEQLLEQKDIITKLKLRLRHLEQVSEKQKEDICNNEIQYFKQVSQLYDNELEKLNTKKGVKARKDLLTLGRWQFAKDWIEDRAQFETVMANLREKIDQQVIDLLIQRQRALEN